MEANPSEKKTASYLAIILIAFIIIVGIIIYVIFSILTKIEYRINISMPKIKSESYLRVSTSYSDFSNSSDYYLFFLTIENLHQQNIVLQISSQLIIPSSKGNLVVDSWSSSDHLPSGSKKRYDVVFRRVFDNSVISGLNYCDYEKPLIEISSRECYKGESYSNQICWEDCKLYTLDSPDRKKNLYCIVSPRIFTSITYDTKILGKVEIEFGSKEERIRWNIRESPIKIYVRPSPLPYNNLLPLDIALELEGYNVFVKNLKISTIGYSVEKETFFEKVRETVEPKDVCEISLNRWLNGRVYLSKENGFNCVIQPINIKIEKIIKDKFLSEDVNISERSRGIIESICKNFKNPDGSINYESCANELTRKRYSLCSIYDNLEICKQTEEYANKLILLIEADITVKEEYSRSISYSNC